MKKILFLFTILCALMHGSIAQVLTHGPVIGAVTSNSARVYVRTSSQAQVAIEVSKAGGERLQTFTSTTDPLLDTSIIINLSGLPSYTALTFTIRVNGALQQKTGTFKTFPEPGAKVPVTFAFGSCIEQMRGDTIFMELLKEKPDFFLHLGDWTYPDHTLYPYDSVESPNYYYSLNAEKVKQVYRVRYGMPHMNAFMEHTPMDFIHDDDDFVFDGNSRYTQSGSYLKGKKTILFENPLPDHARQNAIDAYLRYFPHYPIEHDSTNGLYHSIRYGNVEIFFLDSRADRDSENGAFKVSRRGRLRYAPDSTHLMLGHEQMDWLLGGLAHSTADWKFIVSGTNFNMAYHRVINLALRFQNVMMQPGITGGSIASMLDATWAGYPYDQARLINFCAGNKIKNVVVLSGDAHSSCIDDGRNSGLPELVGANLAVENSRIPSILYNKVGLNLWDQGGQGIGNDNYNYCFGRVEVYGSDSVRLNVVDYHGNLVTSYTLHDGILAQPVNLDDMRHSTHHTRTQTRRDLFTLIGHRLRRHKKK